MVAVERAVINVQRCKSHSDYFPVEVLEGDVLQGVCALHFSTVTIFAEEERTAARQAILSAKGRVRTHADRMACTIDGQRIELRRSYLILVNAIHQHRIDVFTGGCHMNVLVQLDIGQQFHRVAIRCGGNCRLKRLVLVRGRTIVANNLRDIGGNNINLVQGIRRPAGLEVGDVKARAVGGIVVAENPCRITIIRSLFTLCNEIALHILRHRIVEYLFIRATPVAVLYKAGTVQLLLITGIQAAERNRRSVFYALVGIQRSLNGHIIHILLSTVQHCAKSVRHIAAVVRDNNPMFVTRQVCVQDAGIRARQRTGIGAVVEGFGAVRTLCGAHDTAGIVGRTDSSIVMAVFKRNVVRD